MIAAPEKRAAPVGRRREQAGPPPDPSLAGVAVILGLVMAGLYVLRLASDGVAHPMEHIIGLLFWGGVLAMTCYLGIVQMRHPGLGAQRLAVIAVLLGALASMGLIFEINAASDGLHVHSMSDRVLEP